MYGTVYCTVSLVHGGVVYGTRWVPGWGIPGWVGGVIPGHPAAKGPMLEEGI